MDGLIFCAVSCCQGKEYCLFPGPEILLIYQRKKGVKRMGRFHRRERDPTISGSVCCPWEETCVMPWKWQCLEDGIPEQAGILLYSIRGKFTRRLEDMGQKWGELFKIKNYIKLYLKWGELYLVRGKTQEISGGTNLIVSQTRRRNFFGWMCVTLVWHPFVYHT